jgi:hypothetical protein
MHKATAYALLAEELEIWRKKGAGELAALAGQPAYSREVNADVLERCGIEGSRRGDSSNRAGSRDEAMRACLSIIERFKNA